MHQGQSKDNMNQKGELPWRFLSRHQQRKGGGSTFHRMHSESIQIPMMINNFLVY